MAWCHISEMLPSIFHGIMFRYVFRVFLGDPFLQHIKHCLWIFHLYFQLPYRPEETCFQQAGSSVVEGTSQAVLGSSD